MSGLNVQGTPLVDPSNPGIGPIINGVTWVFTVLAILVVSLRFYLRKAGKHGWSADDWIMLAALGLQITWQALVTKACQWGLGKQFVNVTLTEYRKFGEYQYAAQIFINFNPLVSRISIAVLLHSLFGRTRQWFSRLIFGWVAFMAVGSLLTNILTLTKSDPFESNWDHTIPSRPRFDPYIQYYTAIGFVYQMAISDLLFSFLPVSFIWKLQLPTHKRVGLSVLMSAGILTFGAAVAKIVIPTLQVRGQVSAETAPVFGGVIFLVSGIEQGLVIILGCVPALGPLSAIATNFYSVIGQSIMSLVTKSKKTLSRRSSREGSAETENAQTGFPKRISDEEALRIEAALPLDSLIDTSEYITRTDDVVITHEKTGHSWN